MTKIQISISALWNHPYFCHARTCVPFFRSKVLLTFLDVATDLYTGKVIYFPINLIVFIKSFFLISGLTHFRNGDVVWGTLTILVMFLPFIAIFATSFSSYLWFKMKQYYHKNPKKPRFSSGWQHLPFAQAFR